MRFFLAILLAVIAAPAASAGVDLDANCQNWSRAMLRRESDVCGDLCPQALRFDKYDYRAGLKAAYASRTGLSSLIAYTGRSTIIGAGGDVIDHPRGSGDFSNLSGRCFDRAHSKFIQVPKPSKGWPGLFPRNEA